MSNTSAPTAGTARQTQGIIFDQHYSDSLIRLALGKSYQTSLQLGPPAQPDDVLLSLLLFDAAHIISPFWLSAQTDNSRKRLETLEAEGLLHFIPDACRTAAYRSLAPMVEKGTQLDGHRQQLQRLTIDPVSGAVRDGDRSELEVYRDETDLETDLRLQVKRFQHIAPLIASAIQHLGDPVTTLSDAGDLFAAWDLSLGLFQLQSPHLLQSDVDTLDAIESFLQSSIEILATDEPRAVLDLVVSPEMVPHDSYFGRIDARTERLLAEQMKRLRALLLGTWTAKSCERYAAQSQLPLRTSATSLQGATLDKTQADDAYQLFKVQFEALQYPVLEDLDDVRRLRDSRYLHPYRTVIAEYSSRLRADLGAGKPEVLKHFRDDIVLASKDLAKLNRRMSHFDKFMHCFWFPVTLLPTILAILKIDLGIDGDVPYDDILFGPATQVAYHFAQNKHKEVEWILLGRP